MQVTEGKLSMRLKLLSKNRIMRHHHEAKGFNLKDVHVMT